MVWVLWVSAAVTGMILRQILGFQQALGEIAKRMADLEGNRLAPITYQNSITPPWITGAWLALMAIILASVVASSYLGGWQEGGIALGSALLGGIISAAIIRPSATSYYSAAFHALSNRGANFRKQGDAVRADAVDQFCALMVSANGPAYPTEKGM